MSVVKVAGEFRDVVGEISKTTGLAAETGVSAVSGKGLRQSWDDVRAVRRQISGVVGGQNGYRSLRDLAAG